MKLAAHQVASFHAASDGCYRFLVFWSHCEGRSLTLWFVSLQTVQVLPVVKTSSPYPGRFVRAARILHFLS